MKVVLDTNVFISGIFFSGPPYGILEAWRDKRLRIVLSPEILQEYESVAYALSEKFPDIDLNPILQLLTVESEIVLAPALPVQVCEDPDDDKFLACAVASKTKLVVSGDKKLLETSGYRKIKVITPREFVDEYL